jgi:hypothetical protein
MNNKKIIKTETSHFGVDGVAAHVGVYGGGRLLNNSLAFVTISLAF